MKQMRWLQRLLQMSMKTVWHMLEGQTHPLQYPELMMNVHLRQGL